jgi:hypothetical protein
MYFKLHLASNWMQRISVTKELQETFSNLKKIVIRKPKDKQANLIILYPAALHTVANISMHIFSISLIFLVSGILCILNLPREV